MPMEKFVYYANIIRRLTIESGTYYWSHKFSDGSYVTHDYVFLRIEELNFVLYNSNKKSEFESCYLIMRYMYMVPISQVLSFCNF